MGSKVYLWVYSASDRSFERRGLVKWAIGSSMPGLITRESCTSRAVTIGFGRSRDSTAVTKGIEWHIGRIDTSK
jgi:hypothetical protein